MDNAKPLKQMLQGLILRLFYKAFPAPGTGDGDLSLSTGDPDHLAALGAVKIPVLPVFQPVENLQEFPVLLIALIGIPGEGAPNCKDHQYIAQGPEDQVQRLDGNQHTQDAGTQTRAQNHHIQSVRSVTSGHKAAQCSSHFHGKLAKPAAESLHKKSPLMNLVFPYYSANTHEINSQRPMFTECLRIP
jgi:hypothetical protein